MLFKCKHRNMSITERSNVVQPDDMGYPLRLCIVKCVKCGRTEHRWLDTIIQQDDVVLKWERCCD